MSTSSGGAQSGDSKVPSFLLRLSAVLAAVTGILSALVQFGTTFGNLLPQEWVWLGWALTAALALFACFHLLREGGRPPSRLRANLLGRWYYWRSRELRRRILRRYQEEGLRRHELPGLDVQIHHWRPALSFAGFEDRAFVVNGPAGAGKTTYVQRFLRDHLEEFDLLAVIRSLDLKAALGEKNVAGIWNVLRDFYDEETFLELGKLHDEAVAFALSKKPVLVVVEDLHLAGTAARVLGHLRRFFDRYLRWGKHVHLIATTRESTQSLSTTLRGGARLVTLAPLEQRQAQEFFWNLCISNGLARDALLERTRELATAFATEHLRTPLFVCICAWLAKLDPEALPRILTMTERQLLDKYIDELYRTSGLGPEAELPRFRDAYEGLALQFWPKWRDCARDEVQRYLSEVTRGNGAKLDLTQLETSGFLARSRLTRLKVDFPHQAIVDFLAASAMVRRRDFGAIADHPEQARTESFGSFLADVVEKNESWEALGQVDLTVLVNVLQIQRRRGDESPPVGIVTQTAWEWARDAERRRIASETWERLAGWLGSGRTAWIERFCERLAGEDAVSANAVLALVGIHHERGREVLVKWLTSPRAHGAFTEAAHDEQVQGFLLSVAMDGNVPPEASSAVWRIAFADPESEFRRRAEEQLKSHLKGFRREIVRGLSQAGDPALKVIAEACRGEGIAVKRRIASTVAAERGVALIPAGRYEVAGRKTAVIDRPLVVPCVAEELRLETDSPDEAREKLQEELGSERLLSEEEASLALQEFSHGASSVDPLGILFSTPGDSVPEAFVGKSGRIGFYVIPTRASALVSMRGGSRAGSFGKTVRYRRAREL